MRQTPLVWAAKEGHAAVAETLLNHGAAVDLADNVGSTALIFAAQHGHATTAQVLLDNGASVDHADEVREVIISADDFLQWRLFKLLTSNVRQRGLCSCQLRI
ncbi:unnamed protein product [Ostreobium quekettii]|uniref:Ankyrin repeat protein n=1 Tax=Ostreobium quekettii TaxID=121088 RepID=A0A8S1J583_9CHLO|nr:unnamed protein product [Ostreobium quekettii]